MFYFYIKIILNKWNINFEKLFLCRGWEGSYSLEGLI